MHKQKMPRELPDEAAYCFACGRKLSTEGRKPKQRGNGHGSVYQRSNDKWVAIKTVMYPGDEGKLYKKAVSRSDFTTKRDAVAFLPLLGKEKENRLKALTFKTLYDQWEPTHSRSKSTMNCYAAALFTYLAYPFIRDRLRRFSVLRRRLRKGQAHHGAYEDSCWDTLQLWHSRNCIRDNLNLGKFIKVGEDETTHKDALIEEEVEKLRKVCWKVIYPDYVFAQRYLGFRPSEFLLKFTSRHLIPIIISYLPYNSIDKVKVSKASFKDIFLSTTGLFIRLLKGRRDRNFSPEIYLSS